MLSGEGLVFSWTPKRAGTFFSLRRGAAMLTLMAISMAVAPTKAVTFGAICEVGRAALHDLPPADKTGRADTYYAGADTHHRDLLEVCPKLRGALPTDYPLADDDARSRAAIHAPVPGIANPRPAFIFAIDVPDMSDDLRSATVRIRYDCTGLCGGAFEAHYVRTAKGWQRQGDIRMLYVS